MSAVTGQASSNDGTIYNSYHQAGTAQSFCETTVLVLLIIDKHSYRFRAHTWKFNHELVLRTVCMRTECETAIVLYTVHVRTVNNEKRALLAVHAHGKQWSTSRYTPCAHAHRM